MEDITGLRLSWRLAFMAKLIPYLGARMFCKWKFGQRFFYWPLFWRFMRWQYCGAWRLAAARKVG